MLLASRPLEDHNKNVPSLHMTGFVPFWTRKKIEVFEGDIFHFSRTPGTAKSKYNQLLIVASVPSYQNGKILSPLVFPEH